MKPDMTNITADISISTHRIVAALLRDPDEARRVIACESLTLFQLGCLHVDREMGKVASRRLSAPSVERITPLLAARAGMAVDSPAAQENASHAARTALARTLCVESFQLGRARRAEEHNAKTARFGSRTVAVNSDGYYEGLTKGLASYG